MKRKAKSRICYYLSLYVGVIFEWCRFRCITANADKVKENDYLYNIRFTICTVHFYHIRHFDSCFDLCYISFNLQTWNLNRYTHESMRYVNVKVGLIWSYVDYNIKYVLFRPKLHLRYQLEPNNMYLYFSSVKLLAVNVLC